MKNNKTSDLFIYVLGLIIVLFVAWKLIAYILPDRASYNADTFLTAVMDKSGGKNNWNSIHAISYTKAYTLYTKDSLVEVSRKEDHSYINEEQFKRIDWLENGIPNSLHKIRDSIVQYNNSILDTSVTRKQLTSKLQASTFVLGLPYTLDSPSARLSYDDQQSFNDSLSHRLEVKFDGSNDIWWLYYDDELNWLGYLVKTSDHYSLVINEEMQEVNGFTLSRKRKSYRSDAQMNMLYLRAVYEYSDFKID